MEPTLVRHALLALAGGAASVPRARQGLEIIHVRAQLEQLQDTLMS
jgi:hypothetical protein